MDTNTTNSKNKILFPELSYEITGLCFRIHKELGRFRSEGSYGDALEVLLKERNIQYQRELPINPSFEGEANRRNIVDFLIEDKIILELKAKQYVSREEYAQTKRYLTASGKQLGIIINFGQKFLVPKRILHGISDS
jgi:GxxExxY protein